MPYPDMRPSWHKPTRYNHERIKAVFGFVSLTSPGGRYLGSTANQRNDQIPATLGPTTTKTMRLRLGNVKTA